MNYFLAEYEINLDAKGRIMIPAAFRKQLPEVDAKEFVLKSGLDGFVEMYTKSSWERIYKQLSKMNDLNPKVQHFKRMFLNGACTVELDAAGRLLIPKTLQQFAGLEKEIFFSAKGDKIEIWNKDKYNAYIEKNMSDFKDLSTDLFGDDVLNPFEL